MTHSCAFFAFMEPLNLSKKAHHLRALLQVKKIRNDRNMTSKFSPYC